jgi:hypothetical protein
VIHWGEFVQFSETYRYHIAVQYTMAGKARELPTSSVALQ